MRWAAVVFILFALGCEATVPQGRFECATDEDCPDVMVCRVEVARCYDSLDAGPAE